MQEQHLQNKQQCSRRRLSSHGIISASLSLCLHFTGPHKKLYSGHLQSMYSRLRDSSSSGGGSGRNNYTNAIRTCAPNNMITHFCATNRVTSSDTHTRGFAHFLYAERKESKVRCPKPNPTAFIRPHEIENKLFKSIQNTMNESI